MNPQGCKEPDKETLKCTGTKLNFSHCLGTDSTMIHVRREEVVGSESGLDKRMCVLAAGFRICSKDSTNNYSGLDTIVPLIRIPVLIHDCMF